MAEALSGLIMGLVFGALIKVSRFCLTGLIRDIYLEKNRYNAVLVAVIIAVQGLIYHALVFAGLIRGTPYVPPFSLAAIALGSFLFGIGAVLASGCLTMALVKCGDGRLAGLLTLAAFLASAYLVSAGPLQMGTYRLLSFAVIRDPIGGGASFAPVLVCGAAVIILTALMVRHQRTNRVGQMSRGNRLNRKTPVGAYGRRLPMEAAYILIGIWMGVGFPVSDLNGRHYGFSIAMPCLSWVLKMAHPAAVIGGCNTYDQKIGWASFFVLGIIAGSLIAALKRGEFTLVMPTKKTAVKAVAGGALMGVGAMWGQGCLLANGLVATSQFLMKGWYALIFLTLGIWLAARLFIVRAYRS